MWRRFACSTLHKQPRLKVICEASDGLEAVQKAKELQPDLILLDIGLPNLNGIEAAKQIREHSPASRILFLTENHSSDVAKEALKTGAKGYVLKSDAASDLLPGVQAVLEGRRFVSATFAGHDFAEASNAPAALNHVVQFYADDNHLLDNLEALFSDALAEGGSVIAVSTRTLRIGVEERLIAQGIAIDDAIDEGRLAILDANQTLSELMDPAGPNRESFLMRAEETLRRAEAAAMSNGRVVVFGEMVNLLWAQRKYDAAIQLEGLWNELALTHSFYVCCAYPASWFQREVHDESYFKICAEHTQVVSAF
jgi:DNA-binding NarL/FixJ family response regulator